MNEQFVQEKRKKNTQKMVYSAKECAYLAVFVSLVIALQLALSVLPGVELVTVSFVCYSYVMGARRGMIAATAFSLLRQLVFGFFPVVLILYLLYFNLLAAVFGLLGKRSACKRIRLPWLVIFACLGTVAFTLIDNVLTPLWYGYTERAIRAYFYASLSFMLPQLICTAVSVATLFIPLTKTFIFVKRTLLAGKKTAEGAEKQK